MRSLAAITIALLSTTGLAGAAEVFSVRDAILQAVTSNPGVGEAAANRRATETELRQVQSTLLPQVRLEARIGPEKFNDRDLIAPPQGNNTWLNGRTGSVVVRQLLFDGFTSLNEIWRQAARVDAAAHRTHERTELIALDAAEAYIDVVRYIRLVALAQENVAAHRQIFNNVNSRFQGGRAGEGDLQQATERVAAAEAALAEFRRTLDDARAKFRKTVGIEPINLRFPGRLAALPRSKDEALAVTLRHNPTIQAAQSDADAAKYAFHATTGAFVPTVALEGRATAGKDSDSIVGRRDELSGKLVVTWDVFRGGQDLWRRSEMAERFTEQGMRHARLQRDAFESIDRAWAARTITTERVAALVRADRCRPQSHHRLWQGIRTRPALADRSAQRAKSAFQRIGLARVEPFGVGVRRLPAARCHGTAPLVSQDDASHRCRTARAQARPALPDQVAADPPRFAQAGRPGAHQYRQPSSPERRQSDGASATRDHGGTEMAEFTGYTVALDAQTPARWSLKSAPAAQSASVASGSALSYAAEIMQVPLWPIKPRPE